MTPYLPPTVERLNTQLGCPRLWNMHSAPRIGGKILENSVESTVMSQFIIEKDGSITNVKIFEGVDNDIDNESIRVIKKMPEWIPAKFGGKNVRSYFNLPITFRLIDED